VVLLPAVDKVWRFIAAIRREWVQLMTGGTLIAGLAAWEHHAQRSVPWIAFIVIAAVAFCSACFRAWSRLDDEIMRLADALLEGATKANAANMANAPFTPEQIAAIRAHNRQIAEVLRRCCDALEWNDEIPAWVDAIRFSPEALSVRAKLFPLLFLGVNPRLLGAIQTLYGPGTQRDLMPLCSNAILARSIVAGGAHGEGGPGFSLYVDGLLEVIEYHVRVVKDVLIESESSSPLREEEVATLRQLLPHLDKWPKFATAIEGHLRHIAMLRLGK
jgi:hypothetical protein